MPVTEFIPRLVLDCLAVLPHLLKILAALPAASGFDTPMSCKFQGGEEDDVDSEKLSPSSSAQEASVSLLTGKALYENMVYVETLLCFRNDLCNSFGWWDSCTVDRTAKDVEISVSFALCSLPSSRHLSPWKVESPFNESRMQVGVLNCSCLASK